MANSKTEKKTTSKTAVTKKTSTKAQAPKAEEQAPVVAQAAEPVQAKAVKQAKAPKAEAKVAPAPVEAVAPVKASGKKAGSKAEAKVASKAESKSASKAKAPAKAATAVKAPKNLKVAKKAAKPAKAQKVAAGNDEEIEEPGKRYFKCIMINGEGEAVATGRYSGKKPKQAASKACTRLYEEQKEAGLLPEKIVFGMHESTRASKKKKKYFYVGRRVELEEPEEVEIDKIDPKTNKKMIIKYYYNNDVRKLTDLENCQEYPLLFNYDAKDEDEQVAAPAKKIRVVKKATKKAGTKAGTKTGTKKAAPKTGKVVAKKQASAAPAKKAPATKKVVKTATTGAAVAKKAVVKKETNIKVKKSEKVVAPKAPSKAGAKQAKN